MPKVAGKHFSYDAKGIKAAKDYAKKTGKPMKMKGGGKLKMVDKGGEQVPFYAADGVGKMNYGGKVKKMKGGGMCRGMGAATQGGNFKMS